MNFCDFDVYDYTSNFELLKKKSEEHFCTGKVMYVFAGANASGKSTLISHLYRNHSLTAQYINADVFVKTKFAYVCDEYEKNMQAMHYAMQSVETNLKNGNSFVYETVLSHTSKLDLVKKAKYLGYKVVGVFVCTSDVSVNKKRLAARVENGGHNVDYDKLEKRYFRSTENCKILKTLCDEFYVFDNTKERSVLSENVNSK